MEYPILNCCMFSYPFFFNYASSPGRSTTGAALGSVVVPLALSREHFCGFIQYDLTFLRECFEKIIFLRILWIEKYFSFDISFFTTQEHIL